MSRQLRSLSSAFALAFIVFATDHAAADGPAVETIELDLFVEADALSTAHVDLAFPEAVSLDDVSVVHLDALLLRMNHLMQGIDSRANYEATLMSEGTAVITLHSGTLNVVARATPAQFTSVERSGTEIARRGTVDSLRVSVTAVHPQMRASLEGLHAGQVLRLHVVRGALDEGRHAVRTIPNVASIRQEQPGDSPWSREYRFQQPVPVRNLVFVYHSRFDWGTPIAPSTSVSELILSDGTTRVLDDIFAPSLGAPRPLGLNITHSLLFDEVDRELFNAEEDLAIVGWRWRVQVACCGEATVSPGTVDFRFLYDYPDCNANGIPDGDDREDAPDCNANGVLDACEPDCDGNGVPDECDLAAGDTVDCNGNGVPDECDLAPAPLRFREGAVVRFDEAPLALEVGDLDGDDDRDAITLAASTLTALENAGDGTLSAAAALPVGDGSTVARLADFDGDDGDLDIAVGGSQRITLFANDGAFVFREIRTIDLDETLDTFFVEDVSGDRQSDIVVLPRRARSITIWPAQADQPLGVRDGERRLHDLALADLDEDGTLDLVALDGSDDQLIVFSSDGAGSFAVVARHPTEALSSFDRLVGIDRDGAPDTVAIVTASQPVVRLFENSAGGLEEIAGLEAEARVDGFTQGDLDGDGLDDWVLAIGATGSVEVFLASGDWHAFAAGVDPGLVGVLELDGDGKPDIAVLDEAGLLRTFLGGGIEAVSADCDADGVPDECQDAVDCIGSPRHFLRGDLNGDGAVNISDPSYLLNWLFLGGPALPCQAAGDANGDSAVDVSDAIFLLNFLFLGGPAPRDPFPACGPGKLATDQTLGCETPSDCGQDDA